MISRFALLGALCLAVSAGCASRQADVIGHWKGKVAMSKEDQAQPFSNLTDAFAAGVSLDIKPDKTFRMVAVIIPIEGTWSLAGNRVEFRPNEVLGFKESDKPAEGTLSVSTDHKKKNEPFKLELSADGKQLIPIGNGSDTNKMGDFTFTKE